MPWTGVDAEKLTEWERKVEDVTLEETAEAYRGVVDELDLDAHHHDFDGRVVEHRSTWPAGPFGDDDEEVEAAEVDCKITGKKDGVILSLGVEGSAERLQQVLRALERRGVPVSEGIDPNP